MTKLEQYRQGDVLIERVLEIPPTAQTQEMSQRVTLAQGEVTGHHHVLESADPVAWWKRDETSTTLEQPTGLAGELFVSLTGGAKVTHPEHATIELPPASYRVTRQREYSPTAIHNVAE